MKPTKSTNAVNSGKPAKRAKKSRAASPAKPAPRRQRVKLLAGGNPQIAKGDGDEPVQAYIAALTGWKREHARRLDELVGRSVPGVRKAVKWNSPFYGIDGRGWFMAVHSFTHYLKVTFFRGAELRPLPPGASKTKEVRHLDLHETDQVDAVQMAKWMKQAAALPGWKP